MSELTKLSVARFNNAVRYFLAQQHYLMPSTEQLSQVRYQLLANENRNPAIKVAKNYLRRYKDALYLTPDYEDVSQWQQRIDCINQPSLNTSALIELPDGLGNIAFTNNQHLELTNSEQRIILPTIKQKVTLSFCHNNPTCLPDYRNHSRSLKKILQELNISPWQRKRIPFLFYDDLLVAVIGYFVCKPFIPNENDPNISVTWDH